ncbi:hypothetical protein DSO57_1022752 [Entomophthora muscae]|uniref:Uncharacterized protein n=1 Tax=Entomophthora muscae TaxID=34485 RepID=A0ACC2TQ78_9FUNG|nr:hypothetical protein DSO57_1022752 [Entomophthora muscae]
MVFTSNLFDGTSNQTSSSQASFNEVEVLNVEAPVYSQAFDAGNKEADLYLTHDPYGFDLFNSHFMSSSAPTSLPTPAKAANQPTNQNGSVRAQGLLTLNH